MVRIDFTSSIASYFCYRCFFLMFRLSDNPIFILTISFEHTHLKVRFVHVRFLLLLLFTLLALFWNDYMQNAPIRFPFSLKFLTQKHLNVIEQIYWITFFRSLSHSLLANAFFYWISYFLFRIFWSYLFILTFFSLPHPFDRCTSYFDFHFVYNFCVRVWINEWFLFLSFLGRSI